ncbi:hypothetical protein SynNOUM97013_02713 [Synechococcus sp. NOUM97013]|nr:hypothetical protein SynNOUM97013_02713 [Synechococcus sp. NOUM97013]
MAISDESHLLEGGAEARQRDEPPQTIHSHPTERSVSLCPPMMQALQQSAG